MQSKKQLIKRPLLGAVCMLAVSSLFAAAASKNTVNVIDISSMNYVYAGVAVSKLVRNDHGVSMTIDTIDLLPGAYTNWFVIFNDPSECAQVPCSPADGPSSVLFATGNVVDESGEGGFAAHLSVGDTSGALFGPGLTDARGAEVHLVVRYHGPTVPALMPAQINSINGGCNAPGLYDCVDLQAAIHVP